MKTSPIRILSTPVLPISTILLCILMIFSINLLSAEASPDSISQTDFIPILDGAIYMEPHECDGTSEGAIAKANILLNEIGNLPWISADNVTATATLILSPNFCYGNEPVWLIVYHENGEGVFKIVLRWDYEYISMAPWNEEFEHAGLPKWVEQQEGLFPHGLSDFGMWTQDEQAEFSATYIPVIKKMEAENPYIADYLNELYWLTRHTYGVPTNAMLSIDAAIGIAKESCIKQGAQMKSINSRTVEAALDITDATKPIWRLRIGFDYSVKDFTRYILQIDAKTGEVITIQPKEGVGYQYLREVW
ncbi:MAG: hypothetical protein IJG94_12185 [Clostridia bacterium]|nr:hypothetical protein [Clostridia bacterium]